MTFKNVDDIKNYILKQSEFAIMQAQAKVFQVIESFVKRYYAEFSPRVYERTYQLFQSLVKSDIKSTGNGWVAEVYFDLDRLDYYMKKINGIEVRNKGWSEEKTLSAAAHGSHGGYKSGTAIWDNPLNILDQKAIDMLKKTLIDNGIPVR